MNWFARCSIPQKLMWISLLTVLPALIFAFAGFLSFEIAESRKNLIEQYSEHTKLIGWLCSRSLRERDLLDANKLLKANEINPSIAVVCIYDDKGRGFARYLRNDYIHYQFPRVQLDGAWIKNNQVEVFRRVSSDDEFIGTVYLLADIEPISVRALKYCGVILIVLIISGAVAIVFSYRFHSIISKPIESLSQVAKDVAVNKNYSLRARKINDDELGNLVESFNWMLAQIQLRDSELQAARDELEKRVEERTRDLVLANEMLKLEVAERKKTQESLLNSQQKLLLHIQQTPLGVIDWTLEQKVVNWNPTATKIFEYKEIEIIGNSAEDLIVPEELKSENRKNWELLLKRSGGTHIITRNKTKSGKTVTCEWFNTLLTNRDGIPIGVVSLVNDITREIESEIELRKTEEKFRRSQKMQAVGQLAAGVAHDFSNVLTIIQGHLGMVLNKEKVSRDVYESLKLAYDASARAANLVKQLLAFSRNSPVHKKPLNLNETINNFYSLINRVIGDHIKTEIKLDTSIPPINADFGLIDQVILNLSLNARDAMPQGGKLIFKTEFVIIDRENIDKHPEAKEGNYVALHISDTGCGMDEKVRQRIFEPFFTTKEQGKGTGLGLAVVYGIVKQHNGWIEVESEVGKGTTFKIYFPCANDKIISNPAQPLQNLSMEELRGNENVLIVEDEPALRELVGGILKYYGYNVVVAGSGVEAIQIWNEFNHNFHLVMTDMVMPGMTGRDLIKDLKKDKEELKVIYTSGYNIESGQNDFTVRDGYIFLAKPFHPLLMLRTIRLFLDNKYSDINANQNMTQFLKS